MPMTYGGDDIDDDMVFDPVHDADEKTPRQPHRRDHNVQSSPFSSS